MIYEIKMPSLGADMDQGKLLAWHIHVNDKIEKGQSIADVETQKAAVEIESYKSGVVKNIIAKEGEIIPVGQVIALIEIEEKKYNPEPKTESRQNEKMSDRSNKIRSVEVPSVLNIREAIAKAMSKSKKEIPHYYLKTTIAVDDLLIWLEKENIKRSVVDRILISAVFIKALSMALIKHSQMNGFYINDQFIAKAELNINLAISLKGGGVMVPALLNVEAKTLEQVNTEMKSLIDRTRDSKLKQKEITDGTITLTILGDLGVEEVIGIIFPNQVALLGIGVIHKAPIVSLDDKIIISNVIKLTLAGDHRVSDGIAGSKFLNSFRKALSEICKSTLSH